MPYIYSLGKQTYDTGGLHACPVHGFSERSERVQHGNEYISGRRFWSAVTEQAASRRCTCLLDVTGTTTGPTSG